MLADRGLDAAISALAARSPVPVGVDVSTGRLPDPVESAAYFVVAEALTNVGQARPGDPVGVRVTRRGDLLVVEVIDDGAGGADPAEGTGLRGLADRVAGVDGTLTVRSPRRRPTSLTGGAAVRVVIAEDSVLLREGLARLLADGRFEVVAQVGDGRGLVAAVDALPPRPGRRRRPHAADPHRRGPAGRAGGPRAGPRDGHPGPVPVRRGALRRRPARRRRRGVGYLLKDRVADVGEFLAAVRRVGDGGTALDPEVVAQLLGRRRRPTRWRPSAPRERDVLSLMAEGRSNAAIADRLVVTDGAVEKHISSIFTKLGLPAAHSDHRRVLAVLTFLRA